MPAVHPLSGSTAGIPRDAVRSRSTGGATAR